MNKKTILIFIIILVIIIINVFIFFYINSSKNSKIGNNTTSQDIVDYILNINSYEAKIELEVKSNKNTNKYIMKQTYKSSNILTQEVLEPSNIAGVKIIRNNNQLKLENTQLNLSSIFENYEYVSENSLDLISFINDYKSDKNAQWEEEKNQIIMTTKIYSKEKQLYISKETKKPVKLQIEDINKKTAVYISYNEVNIK